MLSKKIMLGVSGLLAGLLFTTGCARREPAPPTSCVPRIVEPASLQQMRYPTARDWLAGPERSAAFQPTASGRPESALYGSVRTVQLGRRWVASFHEGVDIAPLHRDRLGRPCDTIHAVAEGRVAYLNRLAGQSSYGKYVVLVHASSVGELYTLYAHLAHITPTLQTGQTVSAGAELGIMGHSSSSPIPLARAHLHFEIGLIANAGFERWYRAQKLKPDHGMYHGHNLIGIDPLAVFQRQQSDPAFTFQEYLPTIPVAFELLLAADQQLDYFQRYPTLWQAPAWCGGVMVLAVSENGLPLGGRNATAAEQAALGHKPWRISKADEEVLGRNGCRLIVRRQGSWTLGASGQRWLEILTHH